MKDCAQTSDAAGPSLVAKQTLLLEPRSILIFNKSAYKNYTHVIDSGRHDVIDDDCVNNAATGLTRGQIVGRAKTRLSLTFRQVQKVMERAEGSSLLDLQERTRKERWFLSSISEKAPLS